MPRNCPDEREADASCPGVGGRVVWNKVLDVEVAVIVNNSELEIAPPWLATVMVAVPGEAIKLAGTTAVN